MNFPGFDSAPVYCQIAASGVSLLPIYLLCWCGYRINQEAINNPTFSILFSSMISA